MLALWNAQPIPSGRSLFNWGERSKILLGLKKGTLRKGGRTVFGVVHFSLRVLACQITSRFSSEAQAHFRRNPGIADSSGHPG